MLPDRLSRMTRRPQHGRDQRRAPAAGACSGPAPWATCSRASSPASCWRSSVTMMLAELGYDIGPILASAGILGVALGFGAQNLVKDFLSGIFMIFEDQYGVGDVGRPRRGQRHRRGGQPAGHPAPRRRRHRLVRPQRRDPAGRQPEPELGAHGARRRRPLPRGPRAGAAGAQRRRPRPVGRRGLRARDHRGAGGLGRRGPHRRRDHHAGDAQDRAAGAVGGGPRDAGRGSRRASTTRASPRRTPRRSWSTRARTTRPPPRGPTRRQADLASLGGWAGDDVLRRDRWLRHHREDRRHLLRGRRRGPGPPAALPRGGPRTRRGAVPAVPGAVLGWADDLLRPPRSPAAADAARAVRRHAGTRPSAGWCTSARASTRRGCTPEQDAQFWDYVTHAAQFMVNTFEEV